MRNGVNVTLFSQLLKICKRSASLTDFLQSDSILSVIVLFRHHRLIYAGDRLAGILLLAVALPAIAAAAIAVVSLSSRSPFIAHRRVGRHGRDFWILKLRTMWDDCPAKANERGLVEWIESAPGGGQKASDDRRVVSRFAAFCRRYSIDELPQLVHVAGGEMSLIGPRPLTRDELDQHYGPQAQEVLSLLPGLAGLWQIRGRSRLSYTERVRLDLELTRTFSFQTYVRILLQTIPAVITGDGAW